MMMIWDSGYSCSRSACTNSTELELAAAQRSLQTRCPYHTALAPVAAHHCNMSVESQDKNHESHEVAGAIHVITVVTCVMHYVARPIAFRRTSDQASTGVIPGANAAAAVSNFCPTVSMLLLLSEI